MKLDPEQNAAATHPMEHALVLAGAGTGKTRTLVARAAHLLREGVEPGRILLLTFTRRAAREMIRRLEPEVGGRARGIVAGTFHHYCLRTMRRFPGAFGVREATVIDRDDQLQLMKLVRGGYRRKKERFPQATRILALYSLARNTNRSPEVLLEERPEDFLGSVPETVDPEAPGTGTADVGDRVLGCIRDYMLRKARFGYLDFDDLLHRFALRLHREERLRSRIQGLVDHVLVDEMQDTNPLQWKILDALRDPPLLFCVGDDAQSIYAFRGADFQNVHAFSDRVEGSATLQLFRNYRSTQEILDVANALLSASSLDYDRNLVAVRGAGIRPRLVEFDDREDEATWIAEDLLERHEGGAPWRDHMVITRTGFAARELESALVSHKIPYRYIGGTRLFHSAHIRDLLALVRAALSHHDELAWMRYLTLWPRVGDKTAARLVEGLQKHRGTPAALEWLAREWTGDPRMARGPAELEVADRPPTEILARAREQLEPLLDRRYENWKDRRRDLLLLEKLARRHRSLAAFLEAYALDPVSASEARHLEETDVVTLITAHSAKGTEAPVCYLIRVEPGMYPHVRSRGDSGQEEEERRILYVAITRARDELILSRSLRVADHRVFWGGVTGEHGRHGNPYLLGDVPEDLLDHEARPGQWDFEEDLV